MEGFLGHLNNLLFMYVVNIFPSSHIFHFNTSFALITVLNCDLVKFVSLLIYGQLFF